jgi:hydrogenase maturation protease
MVGIGNVLRHDDGVGVRVAQRLAALLRHPDVEVLEAGTAGMDIAAALECRDHVVVADAIEAHWAPGTIVRLAPEELESYGRSGLSVHDLHLLDALAETRLLEVAPNRVVTLAVQVSDTSPGIGLSPAVARAFPRLLRLALRELGLGLSLLRRQSIAATRLCAFSEAR